MFVWCLTDFFLRIVWGANVVSAKCRGSAEVGVARKAAQIDRGSLSQIRSRPNPILFCFEPQMHLLKPAQIIYQSFFYRGAVVRC